MGRRNRERITRIEAGIESPISTHTKTIEPIPKLTVLRCNLCGNSVPIADVHKHIEDCWKITLKENETIPFLPDKASVIRWIAHHSKEV